MEAVVDLFVLGLLTSFEAITDLDSIGDGFLVAGVITLACLTWCAYALNFNLTDDQSPILLESDR